VKKTIISFFHVAKRTFPPAESRKWSRRQCTGEVQNRNRNTSIVATCRQLGSTKVDAQCDKLATG